MATRQRTALTDEERAERRKHEQELTEQAVAQLRSSAGWQRWLTVRAQVGLRRYSVRNQCLIALQDPTATRVAGFRAWLKLGYCVRRGESSRIRVWAKRAILRLVRPWFGAASVFRWRCRVLR
jgi:hypothetical protein